MTKKILMSKTVWFALAQAVFGIVGYYTGWIDQGTATTLLFTGFGSLGLRFNTSQPII